MARVLITTDYLTPGDEVDRILRAAGHETTHLPMRGKRDPDELAAALHDIDGALVANEPFTADVLGRAPRLRAIVRTGVGYDSVDVEAAAELGITVSNLPGINANAVAEYTMGLLLSGARRLVHSASGVAAGAWPREDGSELRGTCLGIVGYGHAARALVPLARAFGMEVLVTTGHPPTELPDGVRIVPLDELLANADHVSLHAALTPATRGLIGASELSAMRPHAWLVNTARGGLIDEDALVAAVRAGTIAGAMLDVVDEEPLPADSSLRTCETIVVTSHLAGQSAQARRAAGVEGAHELVASLAGEPRSAVRRPASPRVAAVGA